MRLAEIDPGHLLIIAGSNSQLAMSNALVNVAKAIKEFRGNKPRFDNVSCSQCGNDFGPGDSGFSSCAEHASIQARSAA
jgi:hypothetical protein